MIDLAAIALRRADEQVRTRGVNVMHDPAWRDAPKPRIVPERRRGGRAPSCECGACHKCKNRIAMRAFRASLPKLPGAPRGPRMDAGRSCRCGQPISNKNKSGMCQACHRGLRAQIRGAFTDGGGI